MKGCRKVAFFIPLYKELFLLFNLLKQDNGKRLVSCFWGEIHSNKDIIHIFVKTIMSKPLEIRNNFPTTCWKQSIPCYFSNTMKNSVKIQLFP